MDLYVNPQNFSPRKLTFVGEEMVGRSAPKDFAIMYDNVQVGICVPEHTAGRAVVTLTREVLHGRYGAWTYDWRSYDALLRRIRGSFKSEWLPDWRIDKYANLARDLYTDGWFFKNENWAGIGPSLSNQRDGKYQVYNLAVGENISPTLHFFRWLTKEFGGLSMSIIVHEAALTAVESMMQDKKEVDLWNHLCKTTREIQNLVNSYAVVTMITTAILGPRPAIDNAEWDHVRACLATAENDFWALAAIKRHGIRHNNICKDDIGKMIPNYSFDWRSSYQSKFKKKLNPAVRTWSL